ncbi:MAG: Rrf2 family transcriptional regulator [Alphaproteobacteria bacterium]|nr:Rrf2 family transcriptional regulator [Alphaproteobacteria bacterium]
MAHITSSVEYAIHCLLYLVGSGDTPLSSRDLAELQGVSPSFLAKIFPRLEKAGIVAASEGVRGGYVLARPAEAVTFLDVVDAVEGDKKLFDCQEIRGRCALFEGDPPGWATKGVCGIHAVMLSAEKAMRDSLARTTLADVAAGFGRKAPKSFYADLSDWMDGRIRARASPRRARPEEGAG